jgi:hypothetical protein
MDGWFWLYIGVLPRLTATAQIDKMTIAPPSGLVILVDCSQCETDLSIT